MSIRLPRLIVLLTAGTAISAAAIISKRSSATTLSRRAFSA